LAAAGRADQAHELARLDRQVDPLERNGAAALEALRDPGELDDAHGEPPPSRRRGVSSMVSGTVHAWPRAALLALSSCFCGTSVTVSGTATGAWHRDRPKRLRAHATCSGARRTTARSAPTTARKKPMPSSAAITFVAHSSCGSIE